MNTRQRLLRIQDLTLAKYLQLMTDVEVDLYVELLNSFVESFPDIEFELKAAMEARDIDSVTRQLTNLRETLIGIYAEALAEECWVRLNSFDRERPEKIEAFVIFFLSMLTALSIDIQMAFLIEDKSEEMAANSFEGETTNSNKSILAVDDDTFFLDTFKAALQDIPYKIIGVTSATGALDVLKVHSPDLFALDIEMPGMDGIQLAKEIRAKGFSAPIVFITGNATKEYVSKCMDADAADFIIKPLNPRYAAGRINRLLR